MPYTFLKPKTKNIWLATWNEVKFKWYFWLPFLFIFLFIFLNLRISLFYLISIQHISFFILAIPIFYVISIQNKVRSVFWKEFAEINNWKYQNNIPEGLFNFSFKGNVEGKIGLMFKQGHSGIISNEISGKISDRDFKIYCYQFTVGHGKHSRIYYYTVFSFLSNGTFPHLYLNRKGNKWDIYVENEIPLPKEFEEKFSLYAPKKYEIEALEIFTPDILATLLEKEFPYDVEFIDQEILIFTDGQINNFENLEKKFNIALELNDTLSKKLDKAKFEKIGDMPSVLE